MRLQSKKGFMLDTGNNLLLEVDVFILPELEDGMIKHENKKLIAIDKNKFIIEDHSHKIYFDSNEANVAYQNHLDRDKKYFKEQMDYWSNAYKELIKNETL